MHLAPQAIMVAKLALAVLLGALSGMVAGAGGLPWAAEASAARSRASTATIVDIAWLLRPHGGR